MGVSRILLTGDLLRPLESAPSESESVRRIRWFEDLLALPLATATGLPVERLACEGALTLEALYGDCGLAPSLDTWAELYAGPVHDRLRDRLVEICRDALVVSIELPPSLGKALHEAGIPLIDASVDAHRFLTDIPLAWRSPLAAVRRALLRFGVGDYEIKRRAHQVKAKTRWLGGIDVPPCATLVLDQIPSDSAMIDIRARRRVGWSDYRDHLAQLADRGPMLWRPHPGSPPGRSAADVMPGLRETYANFYQLLSDDRLARVVAISSGGVVEARAFGKEGVHFLDRRAGIAVEGWTTPVPVVGDWLSPHFWSAVLASIVPTNPGVPVVPAEKDFLRRSVNCDWGFGWIDQIVVR